MRNITEHTITEAALGRPDSTGGTTTARQNRDARRAVKASRVDFSGEDGAA